MTTDLSALGALLGLGVGVGAWLVVSRIPWNRAPSLEDRLAPYLRGVRPAGGGSSSVLSGSPGAADGFGSIISTMAHRLERIMGGANSIRARLDQLGNRGSVEQFRAEQVICAVIGAAGGAGVAAVGIADRGLTVVPVVGLLVIGTLIGAISREWLLGLQISRRERRIVSEFPAVAELLALAVGAGEGAVGALDRVARTCHGELADELRRTLADTRTGQSLAEALAAMAARSRLPSVARFVDGVAVAVERGTPLADVLRAQAQDVRELSRRRLMEAGGRREVVMMVPVVFLVLPVTVLFAVYPGLAELELGL